MRVTTDIADRLAAADPIHFRVHLRISGELVYWRPSTESGWVPIFEIGGAVCWWILERMQERWLEVVETESEEINALAPCMLGYGSELDRVGLVESFIEWAPLIPR